MTNAQIPAGRGWYPDPFSKGELLRMFDGARWTDQTRPIPADYDPTQPAGGPKKTASEKKADEAAPRANPSGAPALEKPKEDPVTQAPAERAQGKPARNGTAPMFATPTEKAAERPSGKAKQPEPKKSTSKPAFNTPTEKAATAPAEKQAPKPTSAPAFASPSVRAERPDDEEQPAPAAKADSPFAKQTSPAGPPAPAEAAPAAPAFSFAKPANGGQPEASAPAPAFATPATTATQEAPAEAPAPASASATAPPAPSAVDDTPEEDSETVNNAFANVPQEAAFGMEAVEDFDDKPSSRRPLPGGLAFKGFMGNTRLVTWIVAVLLAVASVAVPLLVPSPVRGVAAECRSISEVVAAYDGVDDFAIDSGTQAKLASAVSTGALDEELTTLVTTAVEENDLRPVVERCLPQES